MPNIPGQIIGEIGEIGKQIGSEAAKAPVEIAQKALESLGTSSKSQGQQTQLNQKSSSESASSGLPRPWEQIDTMNGKARQSFAREALLDLLKPRPKKKEPSIWERIQMEEQKRKEMMTQNQSSLSNQPLAMPSSKRRRGDLYGTKAKQSTEMSKNVRQD